MEVDQETETELEELRTELEKTMGKERLSRKMSLAPSGRTTVSELSSNMSNNLPERGAFLVRSAHEDQETTTTNAGTRRLSPLSALLVFIFSFTPTKTKFQIRHTKTRPRPLNSSRRKRPRRAASRLRYTATSSSRTAWAFSTPLSSPISSTKVFKLAATFGSLSGPATLQPLLTRASGTSTWASSDCLEYYRCSLKSHVLSILYC
jgi:hypothetical protein